MQRTTTDDGRQPTHDNASRQPVIVNCAADRPLQRLRVTISTLFTQLRVGAAGSVQLDQIATLIIHFIPFYFN